jgi:hypothetical protein
MQEDGELKSSLGSGIKLCFKNKIKGLGSPGGQSASLIHTKPETLEKEFKIKETSTILLCEQFKQNMRSDSDIGIDISKIQ